MKKLFLGWMLAFALSGCGGGGHQMVLETAPGTHLPGGLSVCNARDEIGRCKDWSAKSDRCVNPKGPYDASPIVSCASLRKNKMGGN